MNRKITLEKIQEVGERIAREFDPEKVILFGSWAWGDPGPDSDVDFFVIKDTKNNRQTAREIDGSLFPRPFPLDVVLYTPEQVEKRSKDGDFFVNNIIDKGKLLYER
jgi:uncharacterized protein